MDRIFNTLGFALIGICFAIATWRVVSHTQKESGGTTVIRFAHTFLDSGVRETLDQIAEEYERRQAALGKDVDLVQVDIPEVIYAQWGRTQMIGDTAPVIMVNGREIFDDNLTTRHFLPLGPVIDRVNPYNEGTVHEGAHWKDTFFDGMERGGFNFPLAEHFGIPVTAQSVRMFANRQLVEKILARPENAALRERIGPSLIPANFDDFTGLCEAAIAFGETTGSGLVPIAGSDRNARMLMERLFKSQTQRMVLEHNRLGDFRINAVEMFVDTLEGKIPFITPEYRSGFKLQQIISSYHPPGFLQMRREDATFYFSQEKALMITGNSWDAPSFRTLVGDRFDFVIFPLPLPEPGSAEWGRHTLGEVSEADVFPTGTFGITNGHPQEKIEQAIDFLMFLTSVPGNGMFSKGTGWIPSIDGVEIAEETKPFIPRIAGYPLGPHAHFNNAEVRGLLEVNLFLLTDQDAGLERYLKTSKRVVMAELPRIIEQEHENSIENIRQQDTLQAAFAWLGSYYPEWTDLAVEEIGRLLDSAHGNEANRLYTVARYETDFPGAYPEHENPTEFPPADPRATVPRPATPEPRPWIHLDASDVRGVDAIAAAWQRATEFEFTDALRQFLHLQETGEADPRQVTFGIAMTLLNTPPRSDPRMDEVAGLLQTVIDEEPDDFLGRQARYFLGRVAQAHRRSPDHERAQEILYDLFFEHPEDPVAQIAFIKAFMADAYTDPTVESGIRILDELDSIHLPKISDPAVRRCLMWTAGDVAIRLAGDELRAAGYYMEGEAMGYSRFDIRHLMLLRIGTLCGRNGVPDKAYEYYLRYATVSPRASLTYLVKEQMEKLEKLIDEETRREIDQRVARDLDS